jgi:hypothetical protein
VHYQYFALLLIATALAVIIAVVLRVKSGHARLRERRYRGRHVERGHGRHGKPGGSDLASRVLSALARVDVWILVTGVMGVIVSAVTAVFAYLVLIKPG